MSHTTNTAGYKHLLQQAYLSLEAMEAELAAARRGDTEAIAIVGAGCRYPGGVVGPESYWQHLLEGFDGVIEVPAERGWDLERYHHPDPDQAGTMVTCQGGYLEQVDHFDALFFGITPREAAAMDPQHRLLLEVAWEALENAGQSPEQLAGSATGVFTGIICHDYLNLLLQGDPANIHSHELTGNLTSVAPGRLAYLLGLEGPTISVDTACSSSLVAIHLACQSLRAGECDLALAGGVNLILIPEANVLLSKMRVLAGDGRCKTFDRRADGYGRAEGCGMVVLRRLADARARGDSIVALIRGSAINQDGARGGLTVPNGRAQEAVIRQALANAGVEPGQIGYIEAHGTGTELGDPIEVEALGRVFGPDRAPDQTLWLGAVKANMGHAEAAAGVAGVIKTALGLYHGQIPPHPGLEELNPHLALDQIPARIPTQTTPWPPGPRLAGVSGFGMSGANCHLILEQPPPAASRDRSNERTYHILTLAAKNSKALTQLARRHQQHLAGQDEAALGDLCFTANSGRSHFAQRLAVVAPSAAKMAEKLARFEDSTKTPGLISGQDPAEVRPRVAFLFTGQGSQYIAMGQRLYETQPVFRAALERCQELLAPHLELPLLQVLYPADDSSTALDHTTYTQPALFALGFALAELWRSWGITPDVVMGHSVGEYTAAQVAGVMSLEDGLRLIATRSRLIGAQPAGGAMASVFADEQLVAEVIAPWPEVSIAAVNGPRQSVISGPEDAVQAALAKFGQAEVIARPMTVSHAFHSALMEPMLDEFQQFAEEISYSPPQIQLVSNLSGQVLDPDTAIDAEYWRRHVREPVRFMAGIQELHRQWQPLCVELGPNPVLLKLGRDCVPDPASSLWLPSLRRGIDDWKQLLESLGALYGQGLNVAWEEVDQGFARRRIPLPTYPFNRRRFWYSEPGRWAPGAPTGGGRHPYLGSRLASPLAEIQFASRLDLDTIPSLGDVGGLVHIGVYLELLAAAAGAVLGSEQFTVTDLQISEALMLSEDTAVDTQMILTPDPAGGTGFRFLSCADPASDGSGQWRLHLAGTLANTRTGEPGPGQPEPEQLRQACPTELGGAEFYQMMLDRRGIDLGPSVQWLEQIWRGEDQALALMRLPRPEEKPEVLTMKLHPGLLDACAQLFYAPLKSDQLADVYLFISARTIRFAGFAGTPSQRLWCQVRLSSNNGEAAQSLNGSLCLFEESGREVLVADGVVLRRTSLEMIQRLRQAAGARSQPGPAGPSLSRDQLLAMAPEQRPLQLRTYCDQQLAAIIGADPEDCEILLAEMGLDSLMAMDLQTRIEAALGVRLELSVLLTHQGTEHLATAILEQIESAPEAVNPSVELEEGGI